MIPRVSIIIPVYNVETYLRECLDSVCAQTFGGWECILVDDCSTDSSAAIAAEYPARDTRFRLLRLAENSGQGAARNLGLDRARGEWIAFVDSDDVIAPGYIQRLIEASDGVDMVIEGATCDGVISGREAAALSLYQRRGLGSSPCWRLIRRGPVRFTPGMIYEDLEIIDRLLLGCQTVRLLRGSNYHYRPTPGSTIRRFSLRRLDALRATEMLEERLGADPELGPAARDRRLAANFNMLILLSRNGMARSPEAAACWAQIRRLRRQSLLNPRVRLKNRLGALASLPGRRLFTLLFGR